MSQETLLGSAIVRPGHERDEACHAHGDACHERARIAAARIVAYDLPDRTPTQRARMLHRMGLTRIVWDWREEHTLAFHEELDALAAHDVTVTGLWCPMPLPADDSELGLIDPHVRVHLDEMTRRGLTPDLWTCVEFGDEGRPERLGTWVQREQVTRVASHLEPLTRRAADAGMRVALTNHLGWFGEPENQIEVIEELAGRGLTNVGLAYQLQHGHSHVDRFDSLMETMRPHLLSLALSGVDADAVETGRKILPWGAGRLDRRLAHAVMRSGWHGQLAVQGHSADDAHDRLLDSIEGVEWMIDRWQGVRHPRPVPRIATPAWPQPAGVAPPYMGTSTLGRHARRARVATGEIAPTLARVRTSPPEPAPITLPPGGSRAADAVAGSRRARTQASAPSAATPSRFAPRDPEGATVLGGAFGALAAMRSARSWLSADTPALPPTPLPQDQGAATDGLPWPTHAAAVDPRSRIAADFPVSLLRETPAAEADYAPLSSDADNDAHGPRDLPLRISKREVSLEAPDPYTGALHALLIHLERVGFRGAPRSFGWDANGRHLVEWVSGTRADHPDAPAEALDPARIGRFLRELHDALESFVPPADAMWFDGLPGPGGSIVIHQDIAPSNLVVAEDGRLVAIDWDAAAPGSRLWDLAHAVHAFAPLHGDGFDLVTSAIRMRDLVDGYGLTQSERERLVPLLGLRSERMYEYLDSMRATGQSPWIELWEMGVGTVWERDAEWIRANTVHWRTALLS
ncbi:phosphotransferase [Demequina sp. NBRC 110057]|uniref:phosphotransferase n=1 Tax=Demequina sp. NBRC 110057 TaxID=1570346 RepID=UPI000A062A2E|nr:phosphotransferase [Demequina sp. NBRC 110057]